SARELFGAYATAPFDEEYGKQSFDKIIDWLKTKHHFALAPGDVEQILYVYQYFEQYGPELTYWMSAGFGGGPGGFRHSRTYPELMVLTDQAGTLHSYLATEDNYTFMKQLEDRNMLLPVVGNFAGPKALRAVGAWLKERNGVVSAFYLSNVEQYLNMD